MKCIKKIIAFIASLTLVLGLVYSSNYSLVLADDGSAPVTKICVESTYATPGTTVDINVKISGNIGIMGATLKLSYDDKLSLTGVMQGEAFSSLVLTKPGKYQSPCQFIWDAQELNDDDIKDGTILTLSFKIDEDAKKGDVLNINLSSKYGDIVDTELNSVKTQLESGSITVTDVTPGDLNEDGNINTTDIILMRRFIAGGYNVAVNESAADVNCDKTVNTKDVILLRRYIAGGYGIVLPVTDDTCNHLMELNERKEATCLDDGNVKYWYCKQCGKYYLDEEGKLEIPVQDTVIEAKGHTVVVDEAIEATDHSTGLTEGSHCSVCGKIIRKQEEVPMLTVENYEIKYYIDNNDSYLKQLDIENNNPLYYETEKGLKLTNLKVEGYTFDGWYDGEGSNATQIKEIPIGERGNIELYAHWTLKPYTITFDSPLAPVSSVKYTTNEGKTLINPDWFGYTFMGWSDDDGNIVKRIPVGTTGNITLTANWISKRNQTRKVKSLGEPLIYEDEENGQYLFTYEIGQIENVPLYEIKNFGNRSGIDVSETITTSNSVSSGTANSIVNTIANSTTRSNTWTLSKEWNDSLTQIYSHTDESGREIIDSTSTVSSESTVTVEGESAGGSKGKTSTTEDGLTGKVTGKVEGGIGAGKASLEVSAEGSHTEGGSKSKNKTWGSNKSSESSHNESTNSTTSSALSQKVSDTYGYNKTHSEGGSEVHASSTSNTSSQSDEYASTLTYSNQETQTTTKTYSNANAPEGYYRLVCAGTIHVFAVVGYDIGSSSYYVYTYAVQDDKTYDFIDYSKDTPNFNDYENGALPFEVPYYVNEYVDGVISCNDGLVVDPDTGEVVAYNGNDKYVTIPRYYVIEDEDGYNDVVKISGISSSAFKGKTGIEKISIPETITKIPANAFKGCSNLQSLDGGTIKEIGENAFEGCSNLVDFTIKSSVTSIGKNAFKNVARITAKASNIDVVNGVVESGAKKITLDLTSFDGKLENYKLIIPEGTEYFKLNGANETYRNIQIDSKAENTVISNCEIENTTMIPFKFTSDNITFSKVSASTNNYILTSTSENAVISLYGTVKFESEADKAILCKNINLIWEKTNAVGKLNVIGNILVCGRVDGRDNLIHTKGAIIIINENSFNNALNDSLEWIKIEDLPYGATVVNQKWTYEETTQVTSSNNSMDGYILIDTLTNYTDYGSWSGWSRNAVSSSDTRQVESKNVSDNNGYSYNVYYYYKDPNALQFSYWKEGNNWQYYELYDTNHLAYWYKKYDGTDCYRINNNNGGRGAYFDWEVWWFLRTVNVAATTHKEYRYRDRSIIKTYVFEKTESKVSFTEVVNSDTISNVQKWVQYIN